MTKSLSLKNLIALSLLIILSACGTRDYGSGDEDNEQDRETRLTPVDSGRDTNRPSDDDNGNRIGNTGVEERREADDGVETVEPSRDDDIGGGLPDGADAVGDGVVDDDPSNGVNDGNTGLSEAGNGEGAGSAIVRTLRTGSLIVSTGLRQLPFIPDDFKLPFHDAKPAQVTEEKGLLTHAIGALPGVELSELNDEEGQRAGYAERSLMAALAGIITMESIRFAGTRPNRPVARDNRQQGFQNRYGQPAHRGHNPRASTAQPSHQHNAGHGGGDHGHGRSVRERFSGPIPTIYDGVGDFAANAIVGSGAGYLCYKAVTQLGDFAFGTGYETLAASALLGGSVGIATTATLGRWARYSWDQRRLLGRLRLDNKGFWGPLHKVASTRLGRLGLHWLIPLAAGAGATSLLLDLWLAEAATEQVEEPIVEEELDEEEVSPGIGPRRRDPNSLIGSD